MLGKTYSFGPVMLGKRLAACVAAAAPPASRPGSWSAPGEQCRFHPTGSWPGQSHARRRGQRTGRWPARPHGSAPACCTTGSERNHASSLPLALRQLEAAGNLGNLRLAIAGAHEGYRGPVFMDSDIYKTLEAIGWELSRGGDQELADFAQETTALLEKAQQPDGYLNSAIQVSGQPRYSNLAYSHEMYCAGHLIQAAIAGQRGAGFDRLLAVARRFADHLVDTFLGTSGGLDGHPIVETALVELYRETGYRPYLELASQWIEQRGHGRIGSSGFGLRYLQDHQPVRETSTEVGHVVRALYLEAGVADVAAETGDAALLRTSIDPLGRHDRHEDVPDRRERVTARGGELRRPVRAAAGPGLQRDLRGHRQLPLGVAAAAGHR